MGFAARTNSGSSPASRPYSLLAFPPVTTSRSLFIAALAMLLVGACGDDGGCEEDVRAQVLDDEVEVTIAGTALWAELADEQVERERGWRHRLCDREGILLVPDTRGPLPVFGCQLALPIDVAFVSDDAVVLTERLEPCPEPCSQCPLVGEGVEVDGVLEVPTGAWDLSVGTEVLGVP